MMAPPVGFHVFPLSHLDGGTDGPLFLGFHYRCFHHRGGIVFMMAHLRVSMPPLSCHLDGGTDGSFTRVSTTDNSILQTLVFDGPLRVSITSALFPNRRIFDGLFPPFLNFFGEEVSKVPVIPFLSASPL
jgi:hypothetical protein